MNKIKEQELLNLAPKEIVKLMKEGYKGQKTPPDWVIKMLESMPDDIYKFEETWYIEPNENIAKKFQKILTFLTEPEIRNKNLPKTSEVINSLYFTNKQKWRDFREQIISIKEIIYSADYHLQQIPDLKSSLEQSLDKRPKQFNKSLTTGFGPQYTRKLDYEFQAFLLKLRASLDYFMHLLNLVYPNKMVEFLEESKEKYFSSKLLSSIDNNIKIIYDKYKEDICDDIIVSDDKKTLRNILIHQKYISLVTINTIYKNNVYKTFLIFNYSSKMIESKEIFNFLNKKRDAIINFLIEAIWYIIS